MQIYTISFEENQSKIHRNQTPEILLFEKGSRKDKSKKSRADKFLFSSWDTFFMTKRAHAHTKRSQTQTPIKQMK